MADNQRLDQAESIFFRNELESIDKTIYATLYPGNKGRTLVPTVLDVAESAPVYTWKMTKRFGRAKVGGSLGDDAPRVEVSGEDQSQVIHNVTDSYAYNVLEIKEAARTGTPLDRMRAQAARDTIENEIDTIIALGNAANGLKGLLNLSGVNVYTLSDKAGGGKTWANATAQEICNDIFGMAGAIIAQLKQADAPALHEFVLVIPVEQYTLISQKRMGDGSDKTVLKFVLETSPYIKEIEGWRWCDNGSPGGATDRAVMYSKHPMVLGALVPMEFTPHEPEKRNLEYVVTCLARCGGVICRYPVAMQYADGL